MGYRAYQYRLYPNKRQTQDLLNLLAVGRHYYNMCLDLWRYVYLTEKRRPTSQEFEVMRKGYKKTIPAARGVHSHVFQGLAKRAEEAFQGFFRRVKAGEAPGYPRYKSLDRFHAIEFKQFGNGVAIDGRRVRISGVGRVRVRWHRPMQGTAKTAEIVHKAGQWFVVFTCEVPDQPELPKTGQVVGLDLGVAALFTTSDGDKVDHPKFYQQSQKRLRVLNRALARKKKGGKNRRKAKQRLQRHHHHIQNQRLDYAHKLSYALVQHYDLIALEELKVKNMVRNKHLSKSILDAGWSIFTKLLTNKAVEAGRQVLFVNPAYTSKTCSNCGALFEDLTLADRWVECRCGLSLDRDHNAARNILKQALRLWDAEVRRNVAGSPDASVPRKPLALPMGSVTAGCHVWN
ncbi:MAG: transposase [Chloroflexota bacterium]|nr:transposase [Chloroflexota bacterium]NOG64672.1 IS200/IS605 family element transposase accessory protein TnpB [Chloroflexota bacterium]GIK66331.1 MAG: transposase [Chloroflexota bacterium]